ncbi:MAG: universal stress protein [Thermodesulfobacteriota bacterium]
MEICPALVCPARWDKLMVCTDGSPSGQNAVAVTLELAQACGSLVHVVQVLEVGSEYQAAAEVQKNMEAIKDAAAKLGVGMQPVVLQGPVTHAAILSAAAKISPDLVIMGRRGKTALDRILMGSVTAQVIGHSPGNVMVVPRGAAVCFQRLLVALDGSPSSERAWKLGLAMAKQARSQLLGVAVAPKKGDILEAQAIIQKMLTAAKQSGISLKYVKGISPRGVVPVIGIVQQAINHEVDLIIMGSHGRTGLKKLLMGSTTEKVIGNAPCPVLVVKI